MQALTDDLLDILASRFQAAARGYRCRAEIDYVVPGDTPVETDLALAFGTATADSNEPFTVPHDPQNVIDGSGSTFSQRLDGVDSDATAPISYWIIDLGASYQVNSFRLGNTVNEPIGGALFLAADGGPTDPGHEWARFWSSDDGSAWTEEALELSTVGGGLEEWPLTTPSSHRYWRVSVAGMGVSRFFNSYRVYGFALMGVPAASDEIATFDLRPSQVGHDKSRRMAAAQATLEVPNEFGALDVSADGHVRSHHPIRIWQWYGDNGNEVRTFTGLVDAVREGRTPRTVTLTCRDVMKRLIVQTFSATAPQQAGEAGAVRTAANGVYLETEVSDIVIDILDRAGWPSVDRAISPTSYVLDEYIISDGASWAEAIINDNGPTGLTGYNAWADELGVFHFAPMLADAAPDSDTDPTPDYSYIVGDDDADNLTSRNVLRLDHDIDDYDLKTRVKVRGNLAIAVPVWTELWHTNTFKKPVGIWYDSSEPNHIKVLDRGTKKIYRYKTSSPRDRDPAGIWPLYVGGDVTYPLGLSGDPADSDRFWVLEAAWRATGSANLNASIHKYDASSGAHLAEYSLPDGEWSDIKVSGSWLVLTNKTTDKVSQRSKADGTAHANTTVTYNGNDQLNPTGVFVDGTTYGLFFLGHARFLLVDESEPSTIDTTNALGITSGKISTAGSTIYGGEINPDHAHLWSCNDDLGLVTYYALTEPSTTEIFAEVVDTALEDELGFLSGAQDREHDTHPGDADHPFEVRRATVTLEKTITNIAQATETALRILDELAHRRETVDFGIVGHPGHQRGDLHQLTDPVTGLEALYVLDTYRDNMDERGYLGTAAYVPYQPTY